MNPLQVGQDDVFNPAFWRPQMPSYPGVDRSAQSLAYSTTISDTPITGYPVVQPPKYPYSTGIDGRYQYPMNVYPSYSVGYDGQDGHRLFPALDYEQMWQQMHGYPRTPTVAFAVPEQIFRSGNTVWEGNLPREVYPATAFGFATVPLYEGGWTDEGEDNRILGHR